MAGATPVQRAAVAGGAGRQLARGVALQRQPLALLPAGPRRRRAGAAARVGQVERREVLGDLAQVGVAQRVDQVDHRPVAAPAVAEVQQLVVEVTARACRRCAGGSRRARRGPPCRGRRCRPGTRAARVSAGGAAGAARGPQRRRARRQEPDGFHGQAERGANCSSAAVQRQVARRARRCGCCRESSSARRRGRAAHPGDRHHRRVVDHRRAQRQRLALQRSRSRGCRR